MRINFCTKDDAPRFPHKNVENVTNECVDILNVFNFKAMQTWSRNWHLRTSIQWGFNLKERQIQFSVSEL